LRFIVIFKAEGQQKNRRQVVHKQARFVLFNVSGYFKREGDRRRQIQGVAKPMLVLLDGGMFDALLTL